MENKKSKNYRQNLMNVVVENSDSDTWKEAKTEWIADFVGYNHNGDMCICGKDHICYLFQIIHKVKNVVLYPVGSHCIRQFEEVSMTNVVDNAKKQIRDSRKVKKLCFNCNEPHRNRKDNLCNKCRKLLKCRVCGILSRSVYCSERCVETQKEQERKELELKILSMYPCSDCGVLIEKYERCYGCHKKFKIENQKKSLSSYKEIWVDKLNKLGETILCVGNTYHDKSFHWIVKNDPKYCETVRKFVGNEPYRLLVEYYDALIDFEEKFGEGL